MASSRNTAAPSTSPSPRPLDEDTDYGSDFSEEELQELNREIDRIYGRTPPVVIATEDNPIVHNVESPALDESPSQELARLPRSSQRRGQAVRIEFEDDNTSLLGGGQVAYPDRKLLFYCISGKTDSDTS